jgi:hypothetical protein
MAHKEQMSPEKEQRYYELKETVRNIDLGYIARAKAMREINATNLYLVEYTTFPEFCTAEWELEKSHAYRLIAAAEVVEHLQESDQPVPKNESQAIALAAFADDFGKLDQVWQAAREPGKQTTAKLITALGKEMSVAQPHGRGRGRKSLLLLLGELCCLSEPLFQRRKPLRLLAYLLLELFT